MDVLLSFLSDLHVSDLPHSLQLVGDKCGIRDAVLLMLKCPGIPLYIPASGKRDIIKSYIKKHYNGHNTMSIAVHLGIDSTKVTELAESDLSETEIKMPNEYMLLVAEECGSDVAIRLMDAFPKTILYVPHGGLVALQKRYIQKNFDGTNVIRLAVQLKTSEMFVRKAVADMYRSKKKASTPLQEIRKLALKKGYITQDELDSFSLNSDERKNVSEFLRKNPVPLQLKLL